jgi:hypothetical protein
VIHFNDKLPGFGFRLHRSGGQIKRSWVVHYRRAGGTRRIRLGDAAVLSAEQARKQALKLLGRVASGEDPQAERHDRRSKDKLSTRAVIEEYVAAKEPELRPRSFVEVKRYLLTGGYFRALHPLPIDTVTRKDIAARLVAVGASSFTLALLRQSSPNFEISRRANQKLLHGIAPKLECRRLRSAGGVRQAI